MEEKQVTISNQTLSLPDPFFVFATQNPLENEGTYPLPEAQLDRFLMKIELTYPSVEDEKKIFQKNFSKKSNITLSGAEIIEIQNFIKKFIRVDENIIDYVARILGAYRKLVTSDTLFGNNEPLLDYGPSTRAGLFLISSARVRAILAGRDYVLPEDIKNLAHEIINHRIGLSYFSESENISKKMITEKILDTVEIID